MFNFEKYGANVDGYRYSIINRVSYFFTFKKKIIFFIFFKLIFAYCTCYLLVLGQTITLDTF